MKRFLQDQHLHNFFHHCQSMEMSEQASEGELVKYLKVSRPSFLSLHHFCSCLISKSFLTSSPPQSLHAMEGHVMVNFLPTILNQLFCVLTRATHEDVAVNVTRRVARTHMHQMLGFQQQLSS